MKLDKNKNKLIIFDYDGVFRSVSMRGLFIAYLELLEHLGKNRKNFFSNEAEFRQWYNPDIRENTKRINVPDNDPEVGRIFHKYYDPHIAIFPWAEKLLSEIHSKHTLTLFTSSSSKSVHEPSFQKLKKYFSLVVCSDDVKEIKPSPEGIHFILKKLGRKKNETLIIGDTIVDIMAGKNAGIQTGAVGWGEINTLEDLLELNPDFTFHTPDDLFSI